MGALILCIAMTLAGSLVSFAAAQEGKEDAAVRWDDAKDHLGKEITVEGRVVNTYRTAQAVYLYFHSDPSRFQVVIPVGSVAKFKSDPVIRYKRRNVRVKGKVQESRGIHYIRLVDPKNIEVVLKKQGQT